MYYGNFENINDVKEAYNITDAELAGVDILFALYETPPYEGSSVVLFQRDGQLFIVDAGHCSCYGLEGMWCPVQTNEATLRREIQAKSDWDYEEYKPFIEFCNNHFGWGDKNREHKAE